VPVLAALLRRHLQRYAATGDQALRSYPAAIPPPVSPKSRQPATSGIRSCSEPDFKGGSPDRFTKVDECIGDFASI